MSDTPATVPLHFFTSLYKKTYAETWNCLTQHSQELILQLLLRSWKDQTIDVLQEAFSKGNGPAKIYWDHFRKTLQLKTWMEQSYRPLGLSGNEVLVTATPAEVTLMVFKQGSEWKFGYMETFLERS